MSNSGTPRMMQTKQSEQIYDNCDNAEPPNWAAWDSLNYAEHPPISGSEIAETMWDQHTKQQ